MNVGSASVSSRWPQKTLHHSVGGDWGGRPRDSSSVRREEKRKKKDLRGINDGTPGSAKKEGDPRRIEFGITPAGIKIAQTKKRKTVFSGKN